MAKLSLQTEGANDPARLEIFLEMFVWELGR